MKNLLILLFVISSGVAARAQEPKAETRDKSRFYVGLDLNSRNFLVDYNNQQNELASSGYFIPKPYIHLGYALNKSLRFEIGMAYANDRDHYYVTYVEAPGKYIEYHYYHHTRAFVVPVKLNYQIATVFKNRIGLYTTGSVLPVFSSTQVRREEVKEKETTLTYAARGTGFNTFLSPGAGANFKIWQKITGYYEINLRNYNLTSGKAMYSFRSSRIHPSLGYLSHGLGLNYQL